MGYIFPLISAAAIALHSRFIRKLTDKRGKIRAHPDLVNCLRFFLLPIVLAIYLLIFTDWSLPPWQFWALFFGISLPTEILIAFCMTRAYKYSEQSLVGPLYSITPIFLLFSGWLILNEIPSRLGLLGVIILVMGALGLGWEIRNPGVRRTLSNLFREKGSYYMLIAAFLATITITAAKYGFRYVSPMEFTFYATLGLFLWHTRALKKSNLVKLEGHWFDSLKMTGAYAISMVAHYIGVSLLFVSYYTAMRRAGNVIFDVLFGGLLGQEKGILGRLVAASVMVAGIVLIVLG
jgi:drug/metabolite transporter (DMT)-like permease